jgi:hypothetical protein
MSRIISNTKKINHSGRMAFERSGLCATALFLLLALFPAGKAAAQNASGPLPGAAPSDQPSAASARPTAPVAGKPNLAGTWKLNADQSDNPMQKMREAQQDSGDQGGGGRRGGWGGGTGGGWGRGNGGQNGGGPPNGGDGNQQGEQQGGGGRRQGGMRGMSQLVIEQTPTSARVSDPSGRVLALYLASPEQGASQSSSANSSNSDANTPPVAQWQDSKLVATQQMRNGGTTTRTYELSPDNKQLIVTTKVENKRFKQPVTFRQVYDPVYVSTGGD